MLRKIVSNAIILAASAVFFAGTTACLKNVPQASNTGKDGKRNGAKAIELSEDGEARVRDIVTYPGGDRVDWKSFEIAEEMQGDMTLKLKWKPPRPGGDIAINVYDQWYHRVGQAKPKRKRKRTRGTKRVKLRQLKPGKYYIQIYAPRRTDAGKYTLSLRFKERTPAKIPTLEELAGQISDPPPLAAVIEPKEKTPEEIAAEQEAAATAQAEADRLAAEKALSDAEMAELMKPVFARVRKTQKSSNGVIVTINVGRNKGIEKGWRGTLLNGRSKDALPEGDFKVIKVTASESVAKVKLSLDQVKANPRVRLQRPM